MNLSIIIPLYNEEELIIRLLDELLEVNWPDFLERYEIIIVDDHSNDNSLLKANEYASGRENISVTTLEKNHGKGFAVRTGIERSKFNIILVQDADLELSPEDIPRMLSTMKELGVEFINGSRYMQGITRPLSSYRRYLGNKFFSFLTSVFINVRITDIACGYKLIDRKLLEKIRLKEDRFGFEAELILKALRIKRNNIAEVPVQYFPRNEGEGKKIRNIDGFRIFWSIIKYGILRIN